MRVARSFGPDDVRIEQVDDPRPGPGEVVCDVLACGVCASDVTDWYVSRRLPAVLGHEPVGIFVRKRPQQHGIGDTKDGGACANAQGNGQCGSQCKDGTFPQCSARKCQFS